MACLPALRDSAAPLTAVARAAAIIATGEAGSAMILLAAAPALLIQAGSSTETGLSSAVATAADTATALPGAFCSGSFRGDETFCLFSPRIPSEYV